jgi:hypothetical protein
MTLAQQTAPASTLQRVIQAFGNHQHHLSEDQAQILVREIGIDPLRDLFRGESEELKSRRREIYFLARVMDRLEQGQMPVTLDEARALTAKFGAQALGQRLLDAFQNRNQAALKALQLQIDALRREADPEPGPASSAPQSQASQASPPPMGREPIHRTTLAPPVARQVHTTAPGEGEPVTPTRPPVARQTNVREISPQARQQRQEPAHPPRGQEEPSSRENAPPNERQINEAQAGAGERRYDQHSCYGKDVAVTFECTPNRDRTANTVNIKVAKAKGATCKQGVDWANGIMIALEPHEVQTVLAVLWGMGEKVRYAGHGHDNQKWFEIQESTGDYAGAIRLTLAHGQDRRHINIGHTDIAKVLAIFVRAAESQLRIPSALLPTTCRRAYDLYQKNAERRSASQGQQQRRTG